MKKPLAPTNRLALKSEISERAMKKWQPLAMTEGENTINVLDEIGDDWWSDSDVTVQRVMTKLKQANGADVVVNINSFGGSMFEGMAIYNLLLQYEGQVHVKILGLAASAASVIAMAGDTIEMMPASFLMIHNAWTIAAGNRHDFTQLSLELKPFDDAMASIYKAQSQMETKDIVAMMDAETWINADTALEKGFITGIFEGKVEARSDKFSNAVREVDAILAKQGMSRTNRRELLNQIKGTQDAAQKSMQDAASQEKLQLQAGILALSLQISS